MGRKLVGKLYAVAETGRFSRNFSLRDQILRAGGSIMHNVAEGFDAGSNREFTRFLQYSKRSCSEVQSQLYVALDQAYLNDDQFADLYERCAEARSKIGGFINYLEQHPGL